ncbi:hypothetical protein ACHAXR_005307 [Thalassiosira sp. AJA248-18]
MLPQHLQLDNPYLIDQLQFMQDQESSHYQCGGNTVDYFTTKYATTVTPSDRRTMCTWSYDIVDACSIDREVACIAMSYFDRFMMLCTTTTTTTSTNYNSSSRRAKAALASRREFQLAFIACLIIALKCRAGMHVDSDFVSTTICQNLYDPQEIIDMEKEILSALQWRLNGPSPHDFIGGLIELLPNNNSPAYSDSSKLVVFKKKLSTMSKIQAEVAMMDYSMAIQQSPSAIAYASLLASLKSLGVDDFHPLDRMAWMQNIAMVTDMHNSDCKYRLLRDEIMDMVQRQLCLPPSTTATIISSSTPEQRSRRTAAAAARRDEEEDGARNNNYCSPVSSTTSSIRTQEASTSSDEEEEPYLDNLSLTSSNDDLSPVFRDTMSEDGSLGMI